VLVSSPNATLLLRSTLLILEFCLTVAVLDWSIIPVASAVASASVGSESSSDASATAVTS
jgi:hypothetical protein